MKPDLVSEPTLQVAGIAGFPYTRNPQGGSLWKRGMSILCNPCNLHSILGHWLSLQGLHASSGDLE